MQDHVRRVFLREVERQSAFALMAIADLDAALAARSTDRIWYCVQGALIASGNVSKLLWPTKAYETRGTNLRKDLVISDDSVLAPRTFRNHFEHFDERLEQWVVATGGCMFVDSNVGPPGMIAGLDETKFLRNFDTKNLAVTFQGDSYSLQPIAAALAELHNRAKELANRALDPTGLRPSG
jgi:hypothetical protein